MAGLAARRSLGRGLGTWCFNTLQGLGFQIVPKAKAGGDGDAGAAATTGDPLRDAFERFRGEPRERAYTLPERACRAVILKQFCE